MKKNYKKRIIIKKASGETEPFDVSKMNASLKNAGADDDTISEIAADIENWVYNGVTTGKIYARAYKMFRRKKGSGALRFKLKKALYNMGPTGYPFEHFIGELFKRQGYEVEVGQVVEGVTITRFSSDSLEYSRGKGIKLLGWDYPKNNALKDMIEREKIYPVTILRHLNEKEKQQLMEDGIVTCAQLMNEPDRLNKLGFSNKKKLSVIKELEEII